MKRGELIQVDPAGPTLRFDLNPTTLRRSGRSKRLADVDRPRNVTATEFEGSTPFRLAFDLRLDGYPTTSVHDRILTLEGMAGIHAPTRPPPRLLLRYSGASKTRYVIETLEFGDEVRRSDLAIVRVTASVTLREWVSPDVVASPATRRQQASSAPSGRVHTVVAGDTLWALAVRFLGAGPRWTEIQRLNGGPRDPRLLQIGTRLRIPDR